MEIQPQLVSAKAELKENLEITNDAMKIRDKIEGTLQARLAKVTTIKDRAIDMLAHCNEHTFWLGGKRGKNEEIEKQLSDDSNFEDEVVKGEINNG